MYEYIQEFDIGFLKNLLTRTTSLLYFWYYISYNVFINTKKHFHLEKKYEFFFLVQCSYFLRLWLNINICKEDLLSPIGFPNGNRRCVSIYNLLYVFLFALLTKADLFSIIYPHITVFKSIRIRRSINVLRKKSR